MFQWNFTKHMACGYNQNNKINMPRFEQSTTKKNLKNRENDRLRTHPGLFKTIETEFDSFILEQSANKKNRGKDRVRNNLGYFCSW